MLKIIMNPLNWANKAVYEVNNPNYFLVMSSQSSRAGLSSLQQPLHVSSVTLAYSPQSQVNEVDEIVSAPCQHTTTKLFLLY